MFSRPRLTRLRAGGWLLLVLGAYLSIAQASPAAARVHTLSVQSGLGAPEASDPNVQASSDGTTWNAAYNDLFAFEFPPPFGYYIVPGSTWDSITPDGWAPGPANYYYRTFVVLPPNAANPTLAGQFTADDVGAAFVDGKLAGRTTHGFSGGDPFSSPLTPGSNVLSFAVYNILTPASPINPTGVDFAATASYTVYPMSADQCMDNEWQNYTDRSGSAFKNQGDCVSYVATGGRNPAAG